MRTQDTVEITIQRVGSEDVVGQVPVNSTVAGALSSLGITLNATEQVYFNGTEIDMNTAQVDDGDAVQIVQNKKGGNR